MYRAGAFGLALLLGLALVAVPGQTPGRSASSPRHSGMEAPGGPRQLDVLPQGSPGRTAEGGMGYTDAYGNTLTDKTPEERPRRVRRPTVTKKEPATLPEVSVGDPVWTFK